MRVLGVVPARGGSKGIPRKNLRLLAGKPLLQYTATAALGAATLTRTLLSTDDAEIAALGVQLGLWVPQLRPAALAQDTTPTLEVLINLAETLAAQGEAYEAYCLLQPTSPLRTPQQIDEAVQQLDHTGADAVVSVIPVEAHHHPDWQLRLGATGALTLWNGQPLTQIVPRRQLLSPTYIRNGALYVMRHATLITHRSLYGPTCQAYVMPAQPHINLDTLADWAAAEQWLKAGA